MTTVQLHGWLGSGSFVLSLLLAGVAFMAYRRGETSTGLVAIAVVVAVLMVAQLGLGYTGRRGGVPASIHIPNGVLIAGLLFALIGASLPMTDRSPRMRG